MRHAPTQILYKRAIDRFGPVNQAMKAVEEMGELTQALMKYFQSLDSGSKEALDRMRAHIAEEMADVVVTMDQLGIIFGNCDEVRDWKSRKQRRLAEQLDQLDRWDELKREAGNG